MFSVCYEHDSLTQMKHTGTLQLHLNECLISAKRVEKDFLKHLDQCRLSLISNSNGLVLCGEVSVEVNSQVQFILI